jgi:hypothetical protein
VGALLEGLPVGNIGAGALVCLIVLLILTGRLVPRQQLVDKQTEVDKLWAANDASQAAMHTYGMAMEKLLVLAETTNHALTEIQELAKRAEERPR